MLHSQQPASSGLRSAAPDAHRDEGSLPSGPTPTASQSGFQVWRPSVDSFFDPYIDSPAMGTAELPSHRSTEEPPLPRLSFLTDPAFSVDPHLNPHHFGRRRSSGPSGNSSQLPFPRIHPDTPTSPTSSSQEASTMSGYVDMANVHRPPLSVESDFLALSIPSSSITWSPSVTGTSSSSGSSVSHGSQQSDIKQDSPDDLSRAPSKRDSHYRKPPPSYDAVVSGSVESGPSASKPLVDKKAPPVVLAWDERSLPVDPPSDPPPQRPKAKQRRTSSRPPPVDLDRIDELDETDPLGMMHHHDGPYQAIPTALGHDPHGHNAEMRGRRNSRTIPNDPSPGRRKHGATPNANPMSLNLKPGQILPPSIYQSAPPPPQPPPQLPLARAPNTYPTYPPDQAPVMDRGAAELYARVNAHLQTSDPRQALHRHMSMPTAPSQQPPPLPPNRSYRVPPPTPEDHHHLVRRDSYFGVSGPAPPAPMPPAPGSGPYGSPPPVPPPGNIIRNHDPNMPPYAQMPSPQISAPNVHFDPRNGQPPRPHGPLPPRGPPHASRQRAPSAPQPIRDQRPPRAPPTESSAPRRYPPPSETLSALNAPRPQGAPPDIHLPPPSVTLSSTQSGLAPSHIPKRLVMPTPLASPPPNPVPPNGHAHSGQNQRHVVITTPPAEVQRPKASQIPIHEDGARNLLRKRSAPAAPPSQSSGGVLSFLFGSGKPRHQSASVREPGPRHQSMREPPRGRDMREVRHPRDMQVDWAPDVNVNVRKVVAMNPMQEDPSQMRRKLNKRR